MRTLLLAVALLPMGFLQVGAASAGNDPGRHGAVRGSGLASPAERGELARRFVLKWGGYVQKVHGEDMRAWSRRLVPYFARGDADNLRNALRRTTLEGAMAELDGRGHRLSDDEAITLLAREAPPKLPPGTAITPKALGSDTSDLVYTPITPCRIADSRIGFGGAVPVAGTYNYLAHGLEDYGFQGGNDQSDCGMLSRTPAAVVINVTVVGAAQPGFATIYPSDAVRPTAASLNFSAGDTLANMIIVKTAVSGASDFSLYSFTGSPTHYVVDLMGYFDEPAVTPLGCTTVTITRTISAGAASAQTPACPATYTVTGGGVTATPSTDMAFLGSRPHSSINGWYSGIANRGTNSFTADHFSRCCRVPGS